MGENTKLSIVIVNFNSGGFLTKLICSIYKNTLHDGSAEIIVADNNSTDNSVQFIQKKFSQVKILLNKKNIGFAAANNQVIRESHGEYILLLNPDTLIHKDTLDKVVDYMDRNNSAGIATCRVELDDHTIDDACHRGFPTPWNAFCYFIGLAKLFSKSPFFNGYHLGYQNLDHIHNIDACSGAFMIVRRIAGEQVNWFDEDYFWYGEDLDFCYRIKSKGWKIVFLPYVKITHFKGISSGIKKHSNYLSTADNKTRILATKARFEVMRLFYQKHYIHKYPKLFTSFIMLAIKVKERLNLLKYKAA